MFLSNEKTNSAYQVFNSISLTTALITRYEGNEFSSTGSLREDILNITAVHSMRKDAVENFFKK